MARPPRIIPDKGLPLPLYYFITLCVKERHRVLCRSEIFQRIRDVLERIPGWIHPVGVVMPDHLHLLISPITPSASISIWSACFKRKLGKLIYEDWTWQEGFFDHLIRNVVSGWEKFQYIRMNPERAGFVDSWVEWPYQWGTINPDLPRSWIPRGMEVSHVGRPSWPPWVKKPDGGEESPPYMTLR